MEYFRDKDGQIQADIAYRLGRIISQYESFSIHPMQKFESTLYLAVLQNMLTSCIELLKALRGSERNKNQLLNSLISEENIFGLKESQIIFNSFQNELNSFEFIKHIRNALSHPTKINLESEFCSTGYTTLLNQSGVIGEYCFVSSPDTKSNRLKNYKFSEAQQKLKDENITFPNGVSIIDKGNNNCNFQTDGKSFARIIKIVLTTSELRMLTVNLCTYLAQPTQANWDGITINLDLLAA